MFYLIDKKKGISSFKAIKNFSREKGIKKIGHTGTLDPIASGLLLIATDDDTKLINYIDKGFKTYVAEAKLGILTESYDGETEIIQKKDFNHVTEKILEKTLRSFLGKSEQKPPIFSAKKINGKRAYQLAREGKKVEMKNCSIEIKSITLISFNKSTLKFEVVVSRGTYIRSLIHDIGLKLNTFATMTELQRTKIGFLTLNQVNTDLNVEKMLTKPILAVKKDMVLKLLKGIKVELQKPDGVYIIKLNQEFIGIGKIIKQKLKTKKLFGKRIERLVSQCIN